MLSHTSTEWAPWYVIPADRKWFARIGAAAVLVHALMEIDPRFPVVDDERREELLEVKEALEAQAPKGAAADPFAERRAGRRRERSTDGDARRPQTTQPLGRRRRRAGTRLARRGGRQRSSSVDPTAGLSRRSAPPSC